MMDTEEKLAFPEIEQDTNKYKKHINDLIDDAEIEAEMEAKKKIRSKNSRVFSISMLGLGLLALVYMKKKLNGCVKITRLIHVQWTLVVHRLKSNVKNFMCKKKRKEGNEIQIVD